jgi:uncharacterized lipoprotein
VRGDDVAVKVLVAVLSVLALAGCSSGAAPGTQGVLDQADKATKAQVDVALQDAARAETSHQATTGSYTTDVAALGVNPPAEVSLSIPSATATDFCIEATHPDLDGAWHITSGAPVVTDGPC